MPKQVSFFFFLNYGTRGLGEGLEFSLYTLIKLVIRLRSSY